MKRILVTGANGYLGRGVVKQLLDDGWEVVASSRHAEHIDPRAEIKCADVFALEDPYEYFGRPDVLVHMAWRDGFVHGSAHHIEDLPKHYAFLSRMVDAGLPQAAVLGSMHEVGFYEGCIREDTPTNPQSLYGISKDALRRMTVLKCKERGCIFQWLRGYYIVGNTAEGSSVFAKLAAAAARGDKMFPFTSGENQYDFLDYDVFCRYVADAVTQSEVTGVINICSGRPQRLGDRVEQFIADNRFNIRLQYGAFPDRPYDSKAVWGDDGKLRQILRNKAGEGSANKDRSAENI